MSGKELCGNARRRRELWLNISDHTADFLIGEGFPIEKATEAAEALVMRLISILAGSSVYFARDYSFEMIQRDEEICDRLERGNANDLAIEYGLSFVRIHQIARQVRARRAEKAKAELTDQGKQQTSQLRRPSSGMYADFQRQLGRNEK